MAKYKKFAIAPSGDLVHRATGFLVRDKSLEIRGNRVYKKGRLYGYIGKPSKIQQKIITALDERRQKRRRATERRRAAQPEIKINEIPISTKSDKPPSIPKNEIISQIQDRIDRLESEILQQEITQAQEIDDVLAESERRQTLRDERLKDLPADLSEDTWLLITDIKKWSKFIETDLDILMDPYRKIKQEGSNFVRSVDARVKDKDNPLTYEDGEDLKADWKLATTDKERSEIWAKLKQNDPPTGFKYDPEVQSVR